MSVSYLDSEEGIAELQRLKSVLTLSYGPQGVGAVFQPSPSGGHVTVTSLSQRLLPMLRTQSAVERLLVDSLASHSLSHRDSGLFAGLLATDLILSGLGMSLPRHQVAVVTSHALSVVTGRLGDPSCGADVGRLSLDLSSRLQVSSLLRSLLSSKTALTQLSNSEVDHLTSLLLKSFLTALPKKSGLPFAIGDRVSVHTSLGRPVSLSCLLPGLLLEWSPSRGPGRGRGWGHGWGGEDHETVIKRLRRREGEIVTALFEVSMAGDLSDEFPRDVQLVSEGSSGSAGGCGLGWKEVESAVLAHLMRLADHLVELGVGFVGCQKVVHPLLKDYWQEKGVCVVDRLSTVNLGPVRDLAGGKIIGSLSPNLSPDWLGRLASITHTTIHGQRYVVLGGGGGGATHCSLMLSCPTESVADELRLICSRALHVLQQCLHSPCVLRGGGCTETLISHFLSEKASEKYARDFFTDLQCSERVFRAVMRSVVASFQRVAVCLEHCGGTVLSDSASHHCWFFPPGNWTSPGGCGEGEAQRERTKDTCRFSVGSERKGESSSVLVGNSFSEHGEKQSHPVPADNSQENKHLPSRFSGLGTGDAGWKDGGTREEVVCPSEKTCGCGCVKLSDLPPSNQWIPLGAERCSVSLLESVQLALERARPEVASSAKDAASTPFPSVCDPFLPKLRAMETASDLASTILRISFSVSEKS